MALNNAAWLILELDPGRLEIALDYARRALDAAPGLPAVLDTAAHVSLRLKKHEDALKYADQAIAAARKPSYQLLRAEILLDMGRKADSRAQLDDIVRTAPPRSREAREAAELLRRQG